MQNNLTFLFYALWCAMMMTLTSCKPNANVDEKVADLILYNAYIYPVTGDPIPNGAIVIHGGKIVTLGPTQEILKVWESRSGETRDCSGAFLMPGFIEGHGHFSGLGENLMQLDLLGTKSWQEIVDSVAVRAQKSNPGEWIIGRGWHQEKWMTPVENNVNGYPKHDLLSAVSSQHPVMLFHASGHALFANMAAMEKAGITKETPDPSGGRILRDGAGNSIGVFEENAMNLIWKVYQEIDDKLPAEERVNRWYQAISLAQSHCLSYGITSFQDAGSTFEEIERYQSLAEQDSLNLRLWVMLRKPYDEIKDHMDGFPIIRAGKDLFTCRAIKAAMDGALGSYGAWLLEPYTDNPGFVGQNTTSIEEIDLMAQLAMDKGMQMCVHAIGDRGNREVINVYEKEIKAHPEKQDLRWRIEHAQHLNPADMPRFKQLGIIASMQGIHCTSDAPFVVKRLGEKRSSEGAYAWRSLLDLGVIIANGTDAPVERVDPIPNYYASVTRKRLDNGQVFYHEQAMTREEALYSYTLGNAFAGFEEDIKGSLEPGKWADLVLLSQNLLTCPEDSIPETSVLLTMMGGAIRYEKKH
ncbi:MAG: amidohydrolase [Saprospiraceae bacterium]|nr:amidohydrolase [Candidatus Opimibacter skivensis]